MYYTDQVVTRGVSVFANGGAQLRSVYLPIVVNIEEMYLFLFSYKIVLQPYTENTWCDVRSLKKTK